MKIIIKNNRLLSKLRGTRDINKINYLISPIFLILITLILIFQNVKSDENDTLSRYPHFTENLFEATYEIIGFDGHFGSGFFLGCQIDSINSIPTLITARHVFDSIASDSCKIFVRIYDSSSNYIKTPFTIKIKEMGKPLYHIHNDSTIDLAILRCNIPKNIINHITIFDISNLANEDDFERLWIKPGDEIFYLGYPLNISSNEIGFPVLRSGYISSYPILPIRENPVINIDSPVFEGNSGGPVFLEYNLGSWNKKAMNLNGKILGVVVNFQLQLFKRKLDSTAQIHELYIGGFVNSVYLRDLLEENNCIK